MRSEQITIQEGDLLAQSADAVVNAWNRNIIPWWLLLPHGVSGAIKARAGIEPFIELGRFGAIPLGGAVKTSSGKLPYQCIIHVASIDLLWRATVTSIRLSVINAVKLAENENLQSIAFPILGAGSGGFDSSEAEEIMLDALSELASPLQIIVVRYRKT